ncbi:MAG: anti-phage dCTP deaminase [Syntrophobacteraceae bacterium]
MKLRFTDTYEALKTKLSPIEGDGQWIDLNENQKQFRHSSGGIMNWFPATGTISFQGKPDAQRGLAEIIGQLLTQSPKSAASVKVIELVPEKAGEPVSEAGTLAIISTPKLNEELLGQAFADSELVIGLVGAVGTELGKVGELLKARLSTIGYECSEIHVSSDVIPLIVKDGVDDADEYARISSLMTAGNEARQQSMDNSVLALGAAAKIGEGRSAEEPLRRRQAYIVSSLKHPEEVARLREIYTDGFYLIGVYSDEKRRRNYLIEDKRILPELADQLMDRDADEHLEYGQRTSDTFHLADFFIHMDEDQDRMKKSLWRVLNIMFGDPYRTPTFDEYAMFLAFSASLRSADLSRQVGAVIANEYEIMATGANDCPRYGGGLYWPQYDPESHEISDIEGGRDYKRGEDSNEAEKDKIIGDILEVSSGEGVNKEELRKALKLSKIRDITEYGRVVHAEMEALLSCARKSISSKGATLYCTTFPCHNCAKHIIAAGIERVVYVEPYPKSKAAEFHSDSITLGFSESSDTVHFEPFVGVGPRRFFDLFSMYFGSGYPMKRKDEEGHTLRWRPENSKLRIQLLPCSYIDLEMLAAAMFNQYRRRD